MGRSQGECGRAGRNPQRFRTARKCFPRRQARMALSLERGADRQGNFPFPSMMAELKRRRGKGKLRPKERQGLALVPQWISILPSLSILQSICVSSIPREQVGCGELGSLKERSPTPPHPIHRAAQGFLGLFGLPLSPVTPTPTPQVRVRAGHQLQETG